MTPQKTKARETTRIFMSSTCLDVQSVSEGLFKELHFWSRVFAVQASPAALTRSEKSRWVFLDSFLSDISCLLHDFPIKILAMQFDIGINSKVTLIFSLANGH